ncbi:MAG: hypothetical protein AAB780_00870 [Patescibacteria group bacterium]|mgnify:CR=1 FL=1
MEIRNDPSVVGRQNNPSFPTDLFGPKAGLALFVIVVVVVYLMLLSGAMDQVAPAEAPTQGASSFLFAYLSPF